MNPGIGGVQTYLMNLYRNIDRSKIQMDFIVPGNHCYYYDEIKELGGQIFYISPRKKNVIANILDLARLFHRCRKSHKIVYFNLSILYYNIPFILAKILRLSIVITHAHSTKSKTMKKDIRYYLHRINRIHVAHSSNYLLACSKLAGEWVFGRKTMNRGKVRIIPNAISIDKFTYIEDLRRRIRNKLGIKKEQFVIGNVGRLSYESL